MLVGIHPIDFRYGDQPIAEGLGATLATAEDIGVHSVWFMDHLFQVMGAPSEPMLEAYSALAWSAAQTSRLHLGALVTAVPYRPPGLLLKTVTTLDVLSGGRAWLGIGAAWNAHEARSLGLPFPPLATRFEQLFELLELADRMFEGDASPFRGLHFALDGPINQPPPIRRPPILVGGGGEQKTLRLVAERADATNLFEDEVERKLAVLKRHCDEVRRPFDDIVVTTTGMLGSVDSVGAAVDRFGALAELGVDLALVDAPPPFERVAPFLADVIRQVSAAGRPIPELMDHTSETARPAVRTS